MPALADDSQPAYLANSFSVYCTSNFDGTGKCRRVDLDMALDCIIIPGQVIACRDNQKHKYQCVQYGAVSSYQTQFHCQPGSASGVSDDLFDKSVLNSNRFEPTITPRMLPVSPARIASPDGSSPLN